MIPVFPDPREHAGRAEQIAVICDAPVDSLPFHVLSAVVATAGPLMGFSLILPNVHRTLPVVRPDPFYGIRCARHLMILIVHYINKIE